MKHKLLLKQLNRVTKVTKILDATKPLSVEVTEADVDHAIRKDQTHCAIALACMRGNGWKPKAVIATRSRLYMVDKKDTAVRYLMPPNAVRELTSFDRGASFTPGVYRMTPPHETQKLGNYNGPKTPNPKKKGYKPIHKPLINDIRSSIIHDE